MDASVPSGEFSGPVTFRVKRWAGRGTRVAPFRVAANFVEPSPKRAAVPSIPVVDRWQDGHVAGLRAFPWSLHLGSGHHPPPIFRVSGQQFDPPVGGLTFDPPPLRIHAPGLCSITSVPARPKAAPVPGPGPTSCSPAALVLPAPEPMLGLVPTGSSAQTMKDSHTQLKAQHLKSWLLLLDSAGEASALVCATAHSELASEHRLKAVSHYAPSTMSMYLRIWDLWYDFAGCHNCSAYDPPALVVADYLHVHSSNQGLASGHLRLS